MGPDRSQGTGLLVLSRVDLASVVAGFPFRGVHDSHSTEDTQTRPKRNSPKRVRLHTQLDKLLRLELSPVTRLKQRK